MIPMPALGPARVRYPNGTEKVLLTRWVSGSRDGLVIGALTPAHGIRVEVEVLEESPLRTQVSKLGSEAWKKATGRPVPKTDVDPWAPERQRIPEFAAMSAVLDELGVRKWTGEFRLDRPGHEGDAERTVTAILEGMERGVPARTAARVALERLDWYRH